MILASVLYPRRDGGHFDHDYYETEHRELALDRLSPHGLVRLEMDRGLAGLDGDPAPFVAAGHLYFHTREQLQAALEAHAEALMGDLPNFTDLEPVIQISRIASA